MCTTWVEVDYKWWGDECSAGMKSSNMDSDVLRDIAEQYAKSSSDQFKMELAVYCPDAICERATFDMTEIFIASAEARVSEA